MVMRPFPYCKYLHEERNEGSVLILIERFSKVHGTFNTFLVYTATYYF